MCTAKKPKSVATQVVSEKDLPVLRNPWLDAPANRGVSSLRIDRRRASSGTATRPTVTTPGVTSPTPTPPTPGVQTGGTQLTDRQVTILRGLSSLGGGMGSISRLVLSRQEQ
ncbi:MAG: hypothetical protein ACK4UQ_06575 [Brevundimonas sp.]